MQQQHKRHTYHEVIPIARPGNFVAPAYDEAPPAQQPIQIAPRYEVAHTINAPLSATQHIELRTSAVDRAKGFLIASVPLYAAFAVGVLAVSIAFAGVPFLSFWSFAIFWLSFVLAWLAGYWQMLEKSAEGIAHYEARRKWNIIEEEQRQRWAHYERMIGDKNAD
jgi:hypothetical protein